MKLSDPFNAAILKRELGTTIQGKDIDPRIVGEWIITSINYTFGSDALEARVTLHETRGFEQMMIVERYTPAYIKATVNECPALRFFQP